MSNHVEIKNDEDTVEVSAGEYKAVLEFSKAIADQNALVLKSLDALRGEMVAQAETLTALFGTFKDALAGMNIIVNVPESPAPTVNVTIPDQPAPVVNFNAPADIKKTVKVKRGKNGFADEYVIG